MNNNSPKIALIGYGAMGKAVKAIADKKKIIITDIFDVDSPIKNDKHYDFDVAIDFSTAEAVVKNVEILSAMHKNIVIGATGWLSQLPKIKNICEKYKNGIIYSSNFSVGMQIFSKALSNIIQYINNYDDYDVFLHEIHHNNKIDSPSGTANILANVILNNSNIKKKIITESLNRKIEPEELHVTSSRGGSVFGTHSVYIDSFSDTIELTHRAKNRDGFAAGAIYAAQWIYNKSGIYNFSETVLTSK